MNLNRAPHKEITCKYSHTMILSDYTVDSQEIAALCRWCAIGSIWGIVFVSNICMQSELKLWAVN